MECQGKSQQEKSMKFTYNKEDSWERFNLALKIALSNAEKYPDRTTFLGELSNALLSASGNGRIDWEVMRKIDEKLNDCRKALGDPAWSEIDSLL